MPPAPPPISPSQSLFSQAPDLVEYGIPQLYVARQTFTVNDFIIQAPDRQNAYVYSYRVDTIDATETLQFIADGQKLWGINLGTSGSPPMVSASLSVTPPGYLFFVPASIKLIISKSSNKPFNIEMGYFVSSIL